MRKALATLAVVAVAVLLSSALQANFTMFDLAKDSMFIARGEFTSLDRTAAGDRLTLRCDEMIKGELADGTEVTLEAFEPAPADEALGREVIVCFNLIKGKHLFLYHPFAQRSFIFETDDVAAKGLDQNEQSIRNFMAINEPHTEVIISELQKRLELGLAYEGQYDAPLIDQWRAELVRQASWAGTRAAKDAAKALVEHALFKDTVTLDDLHAIGQLVPQSAVGTLERAYMLELIRNEVSAHPNFDAQMVMLSEETFDACVGKLSNLMAQVENRELVLSEVGALATNRNLTVRTRVNALQMLEVLKDKAGLPYVQNAISGELDNPETFEKDVLRRAFMALRSTPDVTNIDVITASLESDIFEASWELQQRAWVAYAMIDTTATNAKIESECTASEDLARRRFFKKLLPAYKMARKLMIIHNED